jgi:hypothetical protein
VMTDSSIWSNFSQSLFGSSTTIQTIRGSLKHLNGGTSMLHPTS